MIDLKQFYDGKELPEIDASMIDEAKKLAESEGVPFEDALFYILDMMIEKPFGE